MSTPYTRLEGRFRRILALEDVQGLLHWDWSTQMPAGGAESRTEQLTVLAALRHEQITDPGLADLLAHAEQAPPDDPWARANLVEMRRQWRHANALDADLVEALTATAARCEQAWRKARPAADFTMVAEPMGALLNLVRQAAAAKAEALGCGLYDALLDEYEPDGRSADIDRLFADLEEFLPAFLPRVEAAQASRDTGMLPDGPFPVARQRRLGERLMTALGFDFHHGRLDESLHPFCGGTPDDVRITTRYDEDGFESALMGVLHETGHALYDRGLPATWRQQPVGRARGMSLHESQSLLMEMQICRSRDFMIFAAPIIAETLGGEAAEWAPEALYRRAIRVRPGMIRVDADEVTYPAHVILRYRLERDLVEGRMEVTQLPEAWNEGMRGLLGIVPAHDGEGCLQDIHWYDGAWGYFPTYTLGALTAAQLAEALRRDMTDFSDQIRRGDFSALLAWLGERVHGLGSSLSTAEIIRRASGRDLDTAAFKAHLESRYLDLSH